MAAPTETETETENSEVYEDENCLKPIGVFHKTQLCFKFMHGNCRFRSCRFAHGMEELRYPHSTPMPSWSADESYSLDKDTDRDRDRDPPNVTLGVLLRSGGFNNKRRRICYQWEANGTCSFGDKCRYPHEHQKREEETPKGFKNGDVYDWKKFSKPQPGWIPRTLNERAVSHIVCADSVDLPIHVAVNTANVTSTEKSAENFNKEENNAIQVPGCQKKLSRWKGPQKITRIYGDWIDE